MDLEMDDLVDVVEDELIAVLAFHRDGAQDKPFDVLCNDALLRHLLDA